MRVPAGLRDKPQYFRRGSISSRVNLRAEARIAGQLSIQQFRLQAKVKGLQTRFSSSGACPACPVTSNRMDSLPLLFIFRVRSSRTCKADPLVEFFWVNALQGREA